MSRVLWFLLAPPAVAAALLAAGMLRPTPQAGAAAPTIEEVHIEYSFDIVCDGFVLHEEVVLDYRKFFFFDRDGNPEGLQIVFNNLGIITNPAGETFRDPGHGTQIFDFAGTPDDESDDMMRLAGLVYNITVPGEGSVAQDTGLIILESGDVIIRGPHEMLEAEAEPGGSNALLCAALG
jgi:hypothetical protein